MVEHIALITLGCNTGRKETLEFALRELRQVLTIRSISSMMQTTPVDFAYPSPDFLNIVFFASTTLSFEAIYYECKCIEQRCGRSQESKLKTPEVVPLDIDIVAWDNYIYKPRDLYRTYVLDGLRSMLL